MSGSLLFYRCRFSFEIEALQRLASRFSSSEVLSLSPSNSPSRMVFFSPLYWPILFRRADFDGALSRRKLFDISPIFGGGALKIRILGNIFFYGNYEIMAMNFCFFNEY